MTSLDPFLQVPSELLWEIANQVELEDLPLLCQVNHLFRNLCQDWGYWRRRAEVQLGISPRKFDHDGVSKNPAERFYQFWLRSRNCVWGKGYLSRTICLGRALVSNRPDLVQTYQVPYLFSDVFALAIMHDFSYALRVIEHLGVDKSTVSILPFLPGPEDMINWIRPNLTPHELEVLNQVLEKKVPRPDQLINLSPEFSRALLLMFPGFIRSLEEIQPHMDYLSTNILIDPYLSYGIGYHSRDDLLKEFRELGFGNPRMMAYGNIANYRDPEFLNQVIREISDIEPIIQPIIIRSLPRGGSDNEYFRVAAAENLRRYGRETFPPGPLVTIIDAGGIDYLRVMKEMGYDLTKILSRVEDVDPKMISRLREEGLI